MTASWCLHASRLNGTPLSRLVNIRIRQPASENVSVRRNGDNRSGNETDAENYAGECTALSAPHLAPAFRVCARGLWKSFDYIGLDAFLDRRQSLCTDCVKLRLSCEIVSHCRNARMRVVRQSTPIASMHYGGAHCSVRGCETLSVAAASFSFCFE